MPTTLPAPKTPLNTKLPVSVSAPKAASQQISASSTDSAPIPRATRTMGLAFLLLSSQAVASATAPNREITRSGWVNT
jgi:hypothetical protein